MRASFNSESRTEVTAIARKYRKVSPALRDSFLFEFQKALDVVKKHGARMAPLRRDVRVVRLHRFPYGIYYRVIDDAVRILVVKHLSRDLEYGLDRD
jgi:toxin ParE1/3/4